VVGHDERAEKLITVVDVPTLREEYEDLTRLAQLPSSRFDPAAEQEVIETEVSVLLCIAVWRCMLL
jgi:acetylglutamate kinase